VIGFAVKVELKAIAQFACMFVECRDEMQHTKKRSLAAYRIFAVVPTGETILPVEVIKFTQKRRPEDFEGTGDASAFAQIGSFKQTLSAIDKTCIG